MSLDYGLADAGEHPPAASGAVRRRRGIIAGASVLTAAALLIAGAAQPSKAATVGAWQSYTIPSLSDGTLSGGIYAPGLNDAWAAGYGSSTVYAHFDGTRWTSVSGPDIGAANTVGGSSASDVWVIGSTAFAHYNGSAWTTDKPDLPAGDQLSSGYAAVYSTGTDNTWALIPVSVVNAGSSSLLEHFDGTSWSLAGPPVRAGNVVSQLAGSGPDDVYALSVNPDEGQNFGAGDDQVLHFNGSGWSTESVPGLSGVGITASNLAVTGHGDALVAGLQGFLEPWAAQEINGTWSAAALPDSAALDSVVTMTAGTGHAWAVVESLPAIYSGQPATQTLWELSGSSWQQVSTNTLSYITAVADGSGLWSYDPSGGGSVALYAG